MHDEFYFRQSLKTKTKTIYSKAIFESFIFPFSITNSQISPSLSTSKDFSDSVFLTFSYLWIPNSRSNGIVWSNCCLFIETGGREDIMSPSVTPTICLIGITQRAIASNHISIKNDFPAFTYSFTHSLTCFDTIQIKAYRKFLDKSRTELIIFAIFETKIISVRNLNVTINIVSIRIELKFRITTIVTYISKC